ncbi:MAG: hypothetical protein M3Q55_00635 [Acidobacteriota bacterium]|nr:hypothetical protein [Acidobacteriota bacterium]
MRRLLLSLALTALTAPPALAQNRAEDAYTRYELLAPESASFRIIYDVSAVSPGARFFFNPIRIGSEASDESVIDMASGRPLPFEVVSGADALDSGLTNANLQGQYIRVALARPVPEGGEARVRIIKTYRDPKTYRRDGDAIVFDRPLGIARNSIVLPAGYELVACNIPSQILEEADGRIAISFMNPYPVQSPLILRARPFVAGRAPEVTSPVAPPPPADTPSAGVAMNRMRVSERAFQDREIVYFLLDPPSHSFSLYHDYTERRPGTDKYVNVVRAGSTVSNPSARNLDTGEALQVDTLKGDAITKAGIDIGEAVVPSSEAVVIRFPAVIEGTSIRLRIEETYTDPARYGLVDGQLMWHRSFGRPRNDIVLPAGWRVTTSSIPATVALTADGRVRLAYVNPRPDSIDVFVKARPVAR